jgi:hypothetical protein
MKDPDHCPLPVAGCRLPVARFLFLRAARRQRRNRDSEFLPRAAATFRCGRAVN